MYVQVNIRRVDIVITPKSYYNITITSKVLFVSDVLGNIDQSSPNNISNKMPKVTLSADFLLQPRSTLQCHAKSNLFFLVLVHSHPSNFERRQAIRDTWGSVKNIDGRKIKVLFLLGNTSTTDLKIKNSMDLSKPKPYLERSAQEPKSLNLEARRHFYYPDFYPQRILSLRDILSNRLGRSQKKMLKKTNEDDSNVHGDGFQQNSTEISLNYQHLQGNISKEHLKFDDIIQANFTDNDENAIEKHLIGLQVI